MNLRQFATVESRRKALEEESKSLLTHTGKFSLDESAASTRNCENMIGVTQIPLGIAGPLLVKRKSFPEKSYYLPLATTEGALVASVNRGCKVISECGGSFVEVERIGTTRGPVFKTKSLQESLNLRQWIFHHQGEIAETAQQTSSHLKFLSSFVQIVGNLVYIRFAFDTADAMGMNMVTIATQAVCELIHKETSAKCLAISGNFCVDKKPSWQNTILGRGFRAWSEVAIPTNTLTEILKVSVEDLFETWEAKCLIGSVLTGSMGFNGHAANIVGAMFLATGQDISHIVEGSSCITTMEKGLNEIIVRVSMPSIMVGTVGGGTGLATQKEALDLLGVSGGKDGQHAVEFAGIVAAAVLAGEVSELSAIASGSLTQAHQVLGRGKTQ